MPRVAGGEGDAYDTAFDLQLALQAANDHLQLAVDELLATNDELQRNSAELEAMNRALQSTNKALQLVNAQLRARALEAEGSDPLGGRPD